MGCGSWAVAVAAEVAAFEKSAGNGAQPLVLRALDTSLPSSAKTNACFLADSTLPVSSATLASPCTASIVSIRDRMAGCRESDCGFPFGTTAAAATTALSRASTAALHLLQSASPPAAFCKSLAFATTPSSAACQDVSSLCDRVTSAKNWIVPADCASDFESF